MATVSILIPAFKPEYLGRALLSAQQQTFEDIEILVGDDTPGGDLEEIATLSGDPRVRYFHHGFQDGLRNVLALWEHASGEYVKWLFDDDLLMPTSVEALVAALRQHPESALAFHERVFINENDAVIHAPAALLKVGERALITRSFLVERMMGSLTNFVGEPSNVMIVRDRFDPRTMFGYRSSELDFLADVAMYLNLAEQGPLVAVGGYLSAFRQHGEQTSNRASPSASAGLYEWEWMVRGEAAAGNLSVAGLMSAQQLLKRRYTTEGAMLPEIARLLPHLDELTQLPAHQLLDNARYQTDLALARAAVTERRAVRRAQVIAATEARALQAEMAGDVAVDEEPAVQATPEAMPSQTPQNFCAVCETPVVGWLPYPVGGLDLEFLGQVDIVGSTLHKYQCPNCGCNDRDRHLWLYFAFTGLLEDASNKRILHIAPEARLEPRIRALQPREYIAGDLFPRSPQHRRINVEALDFPAGSFDLIICNHVLEHVDDPEKALAEFSRCLAPGGHLVAQTPYSSRLKHTFELSGPTSAAFRTHYFGQNDHVRLFGADLVELFRAAGLSGDLYSHESVLGDVDADAWGCNEHEPFFLFAKSDEPPLPLVNSPSSGAAQAALKQVAAPNAKPFDESPNPIVPKRLPIRLVVATRHADADFMTKTALGRSLGLYRHRQPPQLMLFANNTTGLSTLYNSAIDHAKNDPAILVFIHDDVSICDFFWVERIYQAVETFDVVGLAGNKRRVPGQPAWAFPTPDFKPDQSGNLSGVVGHGKGFPSDVVSVFGPPGQSCKLLDGLMLVADSTRLNERGVRFDDQFAFHFYDMDFCRQAEINGLSLGTWPISVVHESHGAFGSPSWRDGYQRYLQKYGE